MSQKSSKGKNILYLAFIILGIVFACSNVIPNMYLKLAVVMIALGVGLYGLMMGINQKAEEKMEEKEHQIGGNTHPEVAVKK